MPVTPLLWVAEAGELGVRGHPGLCTETHVRFGVNLCSDSGGHPETRKVLLGRVPILGSGSEITSKARIQGWEQ